MSAESNYYNVFDYGDTLNPGQEMKIIHSVSFNENYADISVLATLPLDVLERRRGESVVAETEIYNKLRENAKEWSAQAAQTMLLDKVIQCVKTPPIQHSANQWIPNSSGTGEEISNMVYKMWFRIIEDTKYDRETNKSVPVAWRVSWTLYTQSFHTQHNNLGSCLAVIDNKLFKDEAAMEKYIDCRKKAFSHLFTEISPPIPKEYEKHFIVNGLLMPGYTLAEKRGVYEERQ